MTLVTNYTDEQKMAIISENVKNTMETLGLDLTDDSLCGTPDRVAKMYVKEIFYGLDEKNFPRMMTVENKMGYKQMLVERNIKVHSQCEHHLVPFIGTCHIAYIPGKKVIGLSKLNRLVDFYARKPQIQERLTEEIHAKLCEVLETEDVAVVVDCVHFCVVTRGIKDSGSSTVTSEISGAFKQAETRSEFMDIAFRK